MKEINKRREGQIKEVKEKENNKKKAQADGDTAQAGYGSKRKSSDTAQAGYGSKRKSSDTAQPTKSSKPKLKKLPGLPPGFKKIFRY